MSGSTVGARWAAAIGCVEVTQRRAGRKRAILRLELEEARALRDELAELLRLLSGPGVSAPARQLLELTAAAREQGRILQEEREDLDDWILARDGGEAR